MQQIEIPKKYIYYHGIVHDPNTFEPIHAFKVDKKFDDLLHKDYKRIDYIIEYDYNCLVNVHIPDDFITNFNIKSGGTFLPDFVEKSNTKERIQDMENILGCELKFLVRLYDNKDFPEFKEETVNTCIELNNSFRRINGDISSKINTNGSTVNSLQIINGSTEIKLTDLSIYDLYELKLLLEKHGNILADKQVVNIETLDKIRKKYNE
ncbi:MAG: hypothetical protein [Caudoviricetes sp.]|nr:MAG: hypothetical protein [Caudoviricetes sp.]